MFHRMMNYGGEQEVRPNLILTRDLIKKLMPKYKRFDDLIVVQEAAWEEFKKAVPIPVVREENSPFSIDEDELASLVCQTIQKPLCRRLLVERGIKNDDYRSPEVDLVLGENAIVTHKENQIIYKFDLEKCMFSRGNIGEKMRLSELDCSEEIIVDLFAGIGYFTLPLLVHAKAKHLYACEWNPYAIEALKANIGLNKIDPSRCTVIEGDNKSNRPTDVAQRVILGILPSCKDWMKTAFECVDKKTGAILHCHDLVESKPTPPQTRTSPSPTTSLSGERVETSKPADSLEETAQENADTPVAEETSLIEQPTDKQKVTTGSQTNLLLNQSVSSSSSSHSTIEKLSAPSTTGEEKQSSESDKDTSSSPVLLEKPTGSISPTTEASSSNLNDTSSCSSNQEVDSISEPAQVTDQDFNAYDAHAQLLINSIREEVESHDLTIRLIHIQPVKSYAPHVNHVVFDIKIEPNSLTTPNLESVEH